MRKLRRRNSVVPEPVDDLTRLWMLRMLVPLGAHRQLLTRNGFQNEEVLTAIGLDEWLDSGSCDVDPGTARAKLREVHAEAERCLREAKVPAVLRANIERLAQLLGLSPVDGQILEFSIMIGNERLLNDTADFLGVLSSAKVTYVLSIVLDLPETQVKAALSGNGVLARSGLLTMDYNGATMFGGNQLRAKLNLLNECFGERMLTEEQDPVSLLRDTVRPCAAPHLTLEDFDHISASLKVLQPYLRRAIAERRRGVNIFLYGDPGTGKSQLARVLAKDMNCELFEISSEDGNCRPVDGKQRLLAFRAAQCVFSTRQALILFDEVEDVFDDGNSAFGCKSTAQSRKAWMNRMLEENPVPALWLSNSVSCLDSAFVRRFDMVIEIKAPSKNGRERIVQDACGDFLPTAAIARIAASDSLTPAVIARAASVVGAIREDLENYEAARAFEHLVSSTLEAQGHAPLKKKGETDSLPEHYDPCFINADTDLAVVADGIAQTKAGRLCLYGPPGTGKTAFGRWLADRLGVPLAVKRGSDLLSKWVGGTERNIARAFREAKEDGAVLLLDEVDSFLPDRRGAQRSWEVTEVNEMLTQMESFPGVFIASTNLMDGLDQAALRRFDLKVRFDYLKIEQAWGLLQKHCAGLGLPAPDEMLRQNLSGLSALTPGDFAAVARQHRFRPICSPAMLIAALKAECSLKEDGRKAVIGFR
jgi:SpoVK/Ycf46/Vps4 family AAA+-type ATPase